MVKTIYIIRHGETEYNRMGMVQGAGIDAPLNDTGHLQANAFFEYYKDIPFERIFVSNLRRTTETVQKFIDSGIPMEPVKGLEEISWGSQEGVEFTPESSTLYQETVKRWSKGEVNLRISGGETPIEVMERQKPAMEYILKQNGNPILICTHGRAMRILLSWLTGEPLSSMDQFHHTNTGLYVLHWDGIHFEVKVRNNIEHLELIET